MLMKQIENIVQGVQQNAFQGIRTILFHNYTAISSYQQIRSLKVHTKIEDFS